MGFAVGSGGDETIIEWGRNPNRVGDRHRAGGEPGGRCTGRRPVGNKRKPSGERHPVGWGAEHSETHSHAMQRTERMSTAVASLAQMAPALFARGERDTARWGAGPIEQCPATARLQGWWGRVGNSDGWSLLAAAHSERWIGAQGRRARGAAMSVEVDTTTGGGGRCSSGAADIRPVVVFEVPGLVEASSRGSPEGYVPVSMPGRVSNTQLTPLGCHRRFQPCSRSVASSHFPA